MRLLFVVVGCSTLGAALGCAQSEPVTGGSGLGGFVSDAGATGGVGGAVGGAGGAFGGAGGVTGGAGGAVAGAGGATGGAGGTTGGSGGLGGGTGATGGATGGSGGGACTPPVAGGQCDTWPQCGCTGTQACGVTTQTGVTSCSAAGVVTPYNQCTNLGDCTKGHACVGSACKQYCETNTDCASTGGTCFPLQYSSGGTSLPIPGMKVCSKKCELHNPSAACGPGLTCYPDTQAVPAKTDCAKAGTSTAPGACLTDPTACSPGYACLSSGDCKKWCRVSVPSDCGTGKTCQGWAPPNDIIIDGVTYGICTP
jgi:hypothetical protein